MKTKEFGEKDFPIVHMFDGTTSHSLMLFLKHLFSIGRGKSSELKKLFLVVSEMYKFYMISPESHDKWFNNRGTFVIDYFSSRLNGTIRNMQCEKGLYWEPLRMNTLKQRISQFKKFENFCVQHLGAIGGLPNDILYSSTKSYHSFRSRSEEFSLLAHLGVAEVSEAFSTYNFTHENESRARNSEVKKYWPPQHISEVIEDEHNINYQAIYLLCAFTGLRESEALHVLVSDIVTRGDDYDVILSDPIVGKTFDLSIGALVPRKDLREKFRSRSKDLSNLDNIDIEYLRHLPNRTSLDNKHRYFLGWKGVTLHTVDPKFGYLLNWSCEIAKFKFCKLLPKLLRQRRRQHPYLFCKPDGMPLTVMALEKAIRRKSRRITGSALGPHSLRHFCGYYLANGLELSLEQAQVFLRHASPISTAVYYSKDPVIVRNKLIEFGGGVVKEENPWKKIWG